MFTLPGHILSPRGIGEKHLLRRAFKPLLRPALTQQKKSGFVLPIAQWMKGPLRGFCEDALADLKSSGILQPEGIDAIWKSFLQEKEGSMWIRAWTLCVLGTYINNHSCHR
jgi:asparagine synthase (glutamine-hydrolysing)